MSSPHALSFRIERHCNTDDFLRRPTGTCEQPVRIRASVPGSRSRRSPALRVGCEAIGGSGGAAKERTARYSSESDSLGTNCVGKWLQMEFWQIPEEISDHGLKCCSRGAGNATTRSIGLAIPRSLRRPLRLLRNWARYGVDQRLQKCAFETAAHFGLGADSDWMNSDTDVALPTATDASLQSSEPLTVYTSPNGLLKHARALQRRGTARTPASCCARHWWLPGTTWAMAYAAFDAGRVAEMHCRMVEVVDEANRWTRTRTTAASAAALWRLSRALAGVGLVSVHDAGVRAGHVARAHAHAAATEEEKRTPTTSVAVAQHAGGGPPTCTAPRRRRRAATGRSTDIKSAIPPARHARRAPRRAPLAPPLPPPADVVTRASLTPTPPHSRQVVALSLWGVLERLPAEGQPACHAADPPQEMAAWGSTRCLGVPPPPLQSPRSRDVQCATPRGVSALTLVYLIL
ncbi:hypothetical protein GGX14DRAFT_648087 [Mycena pura]|uniref:Uncharacterized protein n=1 Tax=Mycena pura TaxID=153505 RepID=A0AAD6VA25_9AGAR|nr:hypothetical protein GGX14DRAFT_648087 [Mycena pura]